LALFGVASQANATFMIDPNPSQKDMLKLSEAHNVGTDAASVDGVSVSILANNLEEFASGDSTIKSEKTDTLTDLTFTPANDTKFNDFSFRGQDMVADQVITVKVTDQNGVTQSFSFPEGKANQDFARQGIVSTDGETIKSVELINSGGFEEAKQFAFSLAGVTSAIPEPATWMMMILGVGLVGSSLRASRSRRASLAA
jgi:hypothetical protein